ncbi:MAG: UDP-glucose 4-epimerase GalE [Propionibacteriaceae bacterium]|nr:UDP-glucose 4-epimerase GalE [Propionibacteriaceae bacterium]
MTKPRIVVSGGAGYIGSHVCRLLESRGYGITVIDDLSTGIRERVGRYNFVELDLVSAPIGMIEKALTGAVGVMHFAADKRADQSIHEPLRYYQRNLVSLIRLLAAMQTCCVEALVFSSSSSVYGEARGSLVTEDSSLVPINPYGETKLAGEWLCRDASVAWGLRAVSLRYFNVAGAACSELGDHYSMTLISRLVNLTLAGKPLIINGTDYPTPDGTCIRDYIHPGDVADAHLLALESLLDGRDIAFAYNVGTGTGSSILDVVHAAEAELGRPINVVFGPRREGDSAAVVGDATLIQRSLGWRPRYTLKDIISSSFAAHRFFMGDS